MENDKIKTSRASQSRDNSKRPQTWTPPSSLDAPPAPDICRAPAQMDTN